MTVTDLEMATSTCFSSILHEIQLSNLNFKIEMTPFAAFITLKKKVIKDKNGIPALPSPPIICLLQQAQQEIFNMQVENTELKETVRKCEAEAEESDKVKSDIGFKLERTHEDLIKSIVKNQIVLKETKELENKIAAKDAK